jgi:hypothetical protein
MAKKAKTKKAAKAKRPRDINQLAHYLGVLSTGDVQTEFAPTPSEISRVMSALGQRGGRIGGKKRAEKLTQVQRKQIASKAAKARWANKKS